MLLEVHTSAQMFVNLKMRFFSSGSTSVYQRTTTYIRTSLLSFWMLGWDEEVWCLPVTFVTQVELYSDHSVVCGQPRARVQIVHEYNTIHFVLVTPNRRCSYLQLGRTSSLILHTNCSSGPSVCTNCPSCGLCLGSYGI